jgi:hypothetical protein
MPRVDELSLRIAPFSSGPPAVWALVLKDHYFPVVPDNQNPCYSRRNDLFLVLFKSATLRTRYSGMLFHRDCLLNLRSHRAHRIEEGPSCDREG